MAPRKNETAKLSSTTAQLARSRSVQSGLAEWPSTVEKLDDDDAQREVQMNFNLIVAQRPADSWSPLDLNRAASLAQLLRLMNRDLRMLSQTGTLSRDDKGKLKPSPLLHPLEKMAGLIQQHMRGLGLTWQANDNRTASAHNGAFARNEGAALLNARGQAGAQPISLEDILQ